MDPQIIQSQKGKPLLVFKNFIYHHHDYNKDRSRRYWRCSQRKICNASMTTNNNLDAIQILRDGTGKHLHAADPTEVQVRNITENVKKRAREEPNERPTNVLTAVVGVPPEEVAQKLPERRSMKRMVNRVQSSRRPPNPKTIRDLVITAPYNTTLRGDPFLLYDSGQEDADRLLIFTTDENLRVLAMCDQVFSDGTFKTVPEAFAQLFGIHGKYMGFVFPLVFALTTRLTEETYRVVYERVKERCTQLRLRLDRENLTIMMDFELANMNAVRRVFPLATVRGCLFHFDQTIWRHVVEAGLKNEYETVDSPVRRDVVTLMALPFVPLDDLVEVFEDITEEMDPRLDDIVTNLETNYVKGVQRRRRLIAPRFRPEVWNTYEATLGGEQRTNNSVEGWHNHLQLFMVVRHPTIWRFLENLRKEENQIFTQITQVRGGHTQIREPVNKKYRTNQRQVEAIVDNYATFKAEGNVAGYLRAIGYHLKSGAPPEAPPPADDSDDDDF
jgi:hypothetical protein